MKNHTTARPSDFRPSDQAVAAVVRLISSLNR